MTTRRILFLDAYDSFSNNVVSLLATLLGVEVDVLPIDSLRLDTKSPEFSQHLRDELRRYDAVVCGPGPGSPESSSDVGLMKHIWDLDEDSLLPVLGICLGFQSLAVSCGASIRKLTTGLHGMIREIDHRSNDLVDGNIFSGISQFKATLYHSLSVDIGQDSVFEADWMNSKWTPPANLPAIVPLAWVEEPRNGFSERVLMGMKHGSKPFWGLQYHPESICSESTGQEVIKAWFSEAMRWNAQRGRVITPTIKPFASSSQKRSLLDQMHKQIPDSVEHYLSSGTKLGAFAVDTQYKSESIQLPAHVEVPDIVELLGNGKKDHIVLDSASAHTRRIGLDVRGRYSIIALDVDEAVKILYRRGDSFAIAQLPPSSDHESEVEENIPLGDNQTIWHLLAAFLGSRRQDTDSNEVPFLGGFMGYVTYELGLQGIGVELGEDKIHTRPDLCFAWITKSIVVDHSEGIIRIQHLQPMDSGHDGWIKSVADTLQSSFMWTDGLRLKPCETRDALNVTPPITPTGAADTLDIHVPDSSEYEAKVRQCQDYIASGDSYELCLTDQTSIVRPRSQLEGSLSSNSWAPSSATKIPNSWQTYRSLRTRQPAPFGSYIRLGGATLISSSPERFLEYDSNGLCSMRPMKGTVRKSELVATLEEAETILHIPKEEAENLMIVDLVRHDLHSVCGPGNVKVPQLMKVEEYASVFQMISVVEGQLPARDTDGISRGYTGLDVLAASLPPGSMTGAPKKRSCEILQEIEGHRERSLYSGVVGYMDVAGRGDWSVTIRSLFRWDDETTRLPDGTEQEVWHIGAGGAVTALSTPEGEREEMMTKLKGPLGVFQDRS